MIPTIAAFFVGGLTAIQSRANGSLADVLDSGLQAATISFCIGLLLTSIIVMSSAKLRLGVTRLRTAIRGRQIGYWELFGGFFGALFVLSQSLSVPVIGVALFSVALVSGQSASALIVDRLGLGPHGRQPVTVQRVLAALIGVSAVVVAVSGRLDSAEIPIWLVALCFVAGIGVSVQQAINGRVSDVSGEPLVAAWLNFVVGASILILVFGFMVLVGTVAPRALPSGPLWLYFGGVVGVIFSATTSWVVGKVGVLRLSLLAISGQLVGSLVLDLVVNGYLDALLILGVILAFMAVIVNTIQPKKPDALTGLE
ncbi:MAG: DMT family transporter [Candidatus Nanopelagicales bacterium]